MGDEQWAMGTGEVGQVEAVVTVDADVAAHERGEPKRVALVDRVALSVELTQCPVEIDRGRKIKTAAVTASVVSSADAPASGR